MARPLRIEYAGACYHVMNRGNRALRQHVAQALTVIRDRADLERPAVNS